MWGDLIQADALIFKIGFSEEKVYSIDPLILWENWRLIVVHCNDIQ